MSSPSARLELRIAPENKELVERAAALSHRSVTAFATEVLVARAREILEGPARLEPNRSRPIGGWTFVLPEGWDDPLDDLAEYR